MALQLMQAGYSRVSVVRGGFHGLLEAGVSVAPKDIAPVPPPASLPEKEARPLGSLA
ncbi:MAG: hypothetical protein HY766_16805 [candidate division NC10 bacterium]|nr:hypothetical protein [candidate division NC10 bacterium]MBI4841782.1 hypothetical protein [candidate division NC10 bacterium]